MINSAFSLGGPICTWKTLESVTGLHIDHFVDLDFSGFKNVVDALGGVQIPARMDRAQFTRFFEEIRGRFKRKK